MLLRCLRCSPHGHNVRCNSRDTSPNASDDLPAMLSYVQSLDSEFRFMVPSRYCLNS